MLDEGWSTEPSFPLLLLLKRWGADLTPDIASQSGLSFALRVGCEFHDIPDRCGTALPSPCRPLAEPAFPGSGFERGCCA